jgi:hypothetical protein
MELCGAGCGLFIETIILFLTCMVGCEAACKGTIQAKVVRTKEPSGAIG